MIDLKTIHKECSTFLEESDGMPLLKNLPVTYNDTHKVKVRKKSYEEDTFVETFNEAFDTYNQLRQRAIFANGYSSFVADNDPTLDAYYIFPIDGYQFIYCSEVKHSSNDYKQVVSYLFEEFGSERGHDMAIELLKFSYNDIELSQGIQKGSEIILYRIPYYYAIKVMSVKSYYHILNNIEDFKNV